MNKVLLLLTISQTLTVNRIGGVRKEALSINDYRSLIPNGEKYVGGTMQASYGYDFSMSGKKRTSNTLRLNLKGAAFYKMTFEGTCSQYFGSPSLSYSNAIFDYPGKNTYYIDARSFNIDIFNGKTLLTLNSSYYDNIVNSDSSTLYSETLLNKSTFVYLEPMKFKDVDKPTIDDENKGIVYNNVDDPIDVNEIKSHIFAQDDVDGDITSLVTIKSDNYTLNKNKVGDFEIIFEVTDKSGNSATCTIVVKNKDVTGPKIIFDTGHKFSLDKLKNNKLTNDSILSLVSFEDNDKNVTKKIINTLTGEEIDLQTCTDTFKKAISIVLSDSYGNTSKIDYVLDKYIDDVVPTIIGPDRIPVVYTNILTKEEIIGKFLVEDNYEMSNIKVEILNYEDYTKTSLLDGDFELKIAATDDSSNVSERTILIVNSDKTPPVFTVDESIQVSVTNKINREIIIDKYLLNDGVVSYEILNDTYSTAIEPGKYNIALKSKLKNGSFQYQSINVELVSESNNEDGQLSLWDKVILFIRTINTSIGDFFKKLINWITGKGFQIIE